MPRWTVESVDILSEYWAAKASARVVAARLGVTRNAILGKVYRLHLVHGSGSTEPLPAKPPPDVSGAIRRLTSEGHRVVRREGGCRVDGRFLSAAETIQMAAAYSAPSADRHRASLIVRPLPPPEPDLVCGINGCRGPAQRGRGLCAEHIRAAIREQSAARMEAAK